MVAVISDSGRSDAIIHPMLNARWSFLKKPWVVTGMVFSLLVLVGLGLFVSQVLAYMADIKAGDRNPYERKRLEASVANWLEQNPLTNLDLSRIESNGADPMLGNPAAKIKIVEFLDYQCPFSKRSAGDLRAFVSKHPDEVLLVLRDFPLASINEHAFDAAIAARCIFAQENAAMFWKYHDLLFANQESLAIDDLRQYAVQVRANMPAFDLCVESKAPEKTIRASLEDGAAAGVRGTPTFYINGNRAPGALDMDIFETIFKQLRPSV